MRFIATKELGRLVKWMRILGFDTEYFRESNYSKLKIASLREQRIVITKNTRIGKPQGIKFIQIKSDKLTEQIKELFIQLHIRPDKDTMFSLCTICNIELKPVDKDKIKDKVPEYVFKTQDDFVICPSCQRVYWHGTHRGNVEELLKEMRL